MKEKYGIVLVSHSKYIAEGLYELLQEVAKDVGITYVGGTGEGEIGTTFQGVQEVIEENPCDKILAFYDLGSAKMNLEMVSDFSDKEITIYDVAFVEGAYTAAALLQVDSSIEDIEEQIDRLKI